MKVESFTDTIGADFIPEYRIPSSRHYVIIL